MAIIEKFSDFKSKSLNESKKEGSACSKLESKLCKKLDSLGTCKLTCKEKRNGTVSCDIKLTTPETITTKKLSEINRAIKQCCGGDAVVKSSSGSGKRFEMTIECECK